MSDETLFKVNERRAIKEKLMNDTTRQQKKTLQDLYCTNDKEVKKSCKQDNRNYVEQLAEEAESACRKGDIKALYNISKQLIGKTPSLNTHVKYSNDKTVTKLEDQLNRWREHFQEVMNHPPSTEPPMLETSPTLKIKVDEITKTEFTRAIKHLNNGKAVYHLKL